MPAAIPETRTHALAVDGLCCIRGDRALFDGLTFELGPGEVVQLHGANGSGKTTLLRAICGLVPIEAGRVRWCGAALAPADEAFLGALTWIGHVPGVKADLTPRENLATDRALNAATAGLAPHAAANRVGLGAHVDTPLRRLSAGQGRRTALARLLVTPTPLWVLDEPLSALDADGRALVEALIGEHAARGGLTLLSTHQPLAPAGVPTRTIALD
jgi:heme exporter protein A